ncbi:hypothetical protein LR090_07920, partial [Candidatus Bipolaricaulota bacterium]|nr:hypothetical protein [Candidatus Bipolaricaulota bacterium]
ARRDLRGQLPAFPSYPAELAAFGPDGEVLKQIATFTGGSYAPDELLPPPPGGGRQGVPVGRAFLWAAAGFLLVDLLLRKLLA